MENVFFKNKSEAGESGDYNILVQSGEHIVHNEQTLSNDPQDAKGRVKKKLKVWNFLRRPGFFLFFLASKWFKCFRPFGYKKKFNKISTFYFGGDFFNPSLSGITSERRAMNI